MSEERGVILVVFHSPLGVGSSLARRKAFRPYGAGYPSPGQRPGYGGEDRGIRHRP
jgi:hypothetical protein